MSEQPRPEIVYWFLVSRTPRGGAPLDIREAWIGLALPVRRPRPVEAPVPFVGRDVDSDARKIIDDGVPVRGDDALMMLELFDRRDALVWWQEYFSHAGLHPNLVFRTDEGRLLPPSLATRLHPELDGFV